MSKTKLRVMAILIAASMITGCENAIPELTEEQQDLVVEYAASTLLKYNKNYENKLVSIKEVEAEEQKAAEMKAAIEAMNKLKEDAETEEKQNETAEAEVIESAEPQVPATLEEILQLEQLSFEYTGYEAADDYPEQGEELFFVMSATEGNKLLVLKFQVSNKSDSEALLDMNQTGVRFKLAIDGEEKNALTTMLLNDMAYYQGTIAPGESTELVLVWEIPEEKLQELSALELIVKSVDNIATISLN